ncbi:dicarboxylate/amino acid:cation symporter [Sphingomonas sp. LB-2]|uniref:dicarboxylate/amino acid:cation symporter n=1 Tax=Sphingomonas caeni TaxID=2984949 RepID=UPI00222E522C|nr:dicarboxylate/amino acid:cation symporter [Sphingomonas caeni]MCW3846473.1 dicarboxylate/amino acid:cation symporter [Sphingomonas caeni]
MSLIRNALNLLLGSASKPQPLRILLALVLGLAIGITLSAQAPEAATRASLYAAPVGTLWLNALRMAILPLVVGLLVSGIAQTAEAARAGRIAGRAIALFLLILWSSSILAALLTPALLGLFPLDPGWAAELRTSFAAAKPAGPVPGFGDFLVSLVPTNPITAAANDAFLPLIVFTTAFAFAVTRLPEAPRELLTNLFRALADAMLVVIGWVLWLAPVGVLALSYTVGAQTGVSAFGALVHYVAVVSAVGAVVWFLAYPLAVIGGKLRLMAFLRANAPVTAVAISTQSSLASLPAMLKASGELGVPVAKSGVVLPLAVALFRATGPVMNLAVAIYVAHIMGVHLGPAQLAAGVAAAAITTMGAVSLPGSISFVSSIAPIAIVMGVPIEPLALLVAVEPLPDLVRTLGNVAMDVAVTATVAARTGDENASEADAILAGG